MELLLYFAVCIFSTTIGAVSGIGGGVIIKPALDLLTGLPAASASFLSSCTVFSMSLVTLLRSRSSGLKVEFKRGTPLAVGAALGGLGGKYLFDFIKNSGSTGQISAVQNGILAALTLGVALYMCFRQKIKPHDLHSIYACLGAGLFLGAAGAFLGIGGGPINLVVLYYLFSMGPKTAALNSIYIILVSQSASLLATLVSAGVPPVGLPALLAVVLGGILGGFGGRALAGRLSAKATARLLMGVLSLIFCITVYNCLRFSLNP